MYKFAFEIEINWDTDNTTGEILTRDASLAYAIFNPQGKTYHSEIRTIVEFQVKRLSQYWDEVEKHDISSLPQVKEIKATFPKTHYSVSGQWVRK